MTSLQAQVDNVKTAVAAISTCTPTTVVTLKKLLLPEPSTAEIKTTKPTTAKTKTHARAKSTPIPAGASSKGGELSLRERMALATHVINVTLKSLGDASKPQPPSTPSNQPIDTRQSPGPRRLRRSLSTPLSPLQTRPLNRVATSPAVTVKTSRTNSVSSTASRCLATVECARVAFACLRNTKGPIKADTTDFQIETGMSALVTKLIALGMNELAAKELKILKRRLEKSPAESTDTSSLADLLEYNGVISQHSLPTIAACQIQSLKLIAATKKPAHVEGVLPLLRDSNPLSPGNILSKLAKSGGSHAAKAARQMASLSQTVLSLAPSVSSSEDDVAMEPRLSASPLVAFELQYLAFNTQLKWWEMAGHQGKADDELLSPFSRCLKCFLRRQGQVDGGAFGLLSESFNTILESLTSQGHQPSSKFESPCASIYQCLGAAAQSARQYDAAYEWFDKLRQSLQQTDDGSSVRSCSISARLLAVALKRATVGDDEEQLLEEVTEGLNASLSGTALEVNELLESLSLARRSVAGLLMNNWGEKATISQEFQHLLKKFLLKFPRFVLRWLGHRPGKDASPKQVLQFDQRLQVVMQSINQVLDGTLMIVKHQIQTDEVEWESVDDVLQDCTLLLDGVQNPTLSSSRLEVLSGYHVKLSTLYFSVFSQLRKKSMQSKTEKKKMLQALNRSIEIVKGRSSAEKEKAQLATKLELMADLCKGAGRTEDATKTLRSICTNMVEDGVLANVAIALAKQSPRIAWSDEKASALSRTLRSIAKLDDSLNDWTFFLPEAERAAVLEHLLYLGTEEKSKPLRLHDSGVAALLRIFSVERYPIRRFRVLLMILAQQVGQIDGVDEFSELIEQTLRQLTKKVLGEDVALSHFISHLSNHHTFILALGDLDFPVSTLSECISSWKVMVDSCRTKTDVFQVIDEPDGLLDQLLAVNQLAGLRGEGRLQLSVLELCISLAKACTKSTDDNLILYHCHLATQYVDLGLFTQAAKTLEDTKQLIKQAEKASQRVLVDYYLSQAGYLAGIDQTSEAMSRLLKASDIHSTSSASWAPSKSQATLLRCQASLMESDIALQKGDFQEALRCVRASVKWLSYEWNTLEGPSMNAPTQLAPSLADVVLGKTPASPKPQVLGTKLWVWAIPLLKSLMHISSVYSHIGMFQETVYFAEAALRIAEGTQSSLFVCEGNAWLASVYLRAGKSDDVLPCLNKASEHIPQEICAARVRLSKQISELYRDIGENSKTGEYLKMAEETATSLSKLGQDSVISGSTCIVKSKTTVTKATKAATSKATSTITRPSRTRATAKAATTTTTTRRVARRGAVAKMSPPSTVSTVSKDIYQSSLLSSIILSRATGFMQQEDWDSVASTLELAKDLPKLSDTLRQEKLIVAARHISLSMEGMMKDPVFSVMHDSTISFPAVSGNSTSPTRGSFSSHSPVRKGRANTNVNTKSPKGPAFVEALKQAQEVLLEAHASALATGDNALLHRVSTLLQSTVISLTAASNSKDKATIRSDLTTVAVELARNAAWRREQLTLQLSEQATTDFGPNSSSDLAKKLSDLTLTADMASFQNEFIELVPKNWSVISLSLSENQHDLCLTKFQTGHSPFILRLPLERANSRDADSEIFNFEHGREELLEIIKLANETSHSSKDLSTKAARNAWWAEREDLDARLKDLLTMIEVTWLGGFRGMFSQHQQRPDLLARFQQSFNQMLDKSLPSRNTRGRGKKAAAKTMAPVTLDPRILDLFIGLGSPDEPDDEFDEALTDLLYFVVDILQFHGERNAYDEIDFDSMVVDVYSALTAYFDAAKSGGPDEGTHTILVLDKALHAFPWESMPCMEGLAVSRVPSLACLRRLIMEAKMPKAENNDAIDDVYQGHYVSASKGTYILNPSSDLKATQTFFESSFSQLKTWTKIVKETPKEEAFEQALSTSDILLYFGHGGGAQYIRGKTIRKLEKCRPASFLMGCSSAALNQAGEFECYGPVWNYMMAGCPAVVGTLWDVTDRDIDRFAGKAFEEWGLFAKGTFKDSTATSAGKEKLLRMKRKGKQTARGSDEDSEEEDEDDDKDDDEDEDMASQGGVALVAHTSLVEAVGRSRKVCKLKYLNAAAVVVYGIPVYIDRGE